MLRWLLRISFLFAAVSLCVFSLWLGTLRAFLPREEAHSWRLSFRREEGLLASQPLLLPQLEGPLSFTLSLALVDSPATNGIGSFSVQLLSAGEGEALLEACSAVPYREPWIRQLGLAARLWFKPWTLYAGQSLLLTVPLLCGGGSWRSAAALVRLQISQPRLEVISASLAVERPIGALQKFCQRHRVFVLLLGVFPVLVASLALSLLIDWTARRRSAPKRPKPKEESFYLERLFDAEMDGQDWGAGGQGRFGK